MLSTTALSFMPCLHRRLDNGHAELHARAATHTQLHAGHQQLQVQGLLVHPARQPQPQRGAPMTVIADMVAKRRSGAGCQAQVKAARANPGELQDCGVVHGQVVVCLPGSAAGQAMLLRGPM
jgi:hypothetical protein